MFRQALGATLAAQAEYLRLNTLTAVDPTYLEPDTFVRDVRARIFADTDVWDNSTVADFLRWAEMKPGVPSLLLVIAALDAMERATSRWPSAGAAGRWRSTATTFMFRRSCARPMTRRNPH